MIKSNQKVKTEKQSKIPASGITGKGSMGIIKANADYTKKLMIGIPTTGNIRIEWHYSLINMIIPVNWSSSFCSPFYSGNSVISPMGFQVDHARNICVSAMIDGGFEWLLFIDHDTMPPNNMFLKMNKHMEDMKYPIISGLYGNKACPSDPLVFRGGGDGCYKGWKYGDKVPVSAVVMGCTLIHREVIDALKSVSETYNDREHQFLGMITGKKIWKIFETVRAGSEDPETKTYRKYGGTEDICLCNRIIEEKILAKTKSWKHLAGRKYPFLCDTSIFCGHIDISGRVYPMERWEFAERSK